MGYSGHYGIVSQIMVYYGILWEIVGYYGILWDTMEHYDILENVKGYCSHLCRANTGLRVGTPERRDPIVGVHIARILV